MEKRTIRVVLDLKGAMQDKAAGMPEMMELDRMGSVAVFALLEEWICYRAEEAAGDLS